MGGVVLVWECGLRGSNWRLGAAHPVLHVSLLLLLLLLLMVEVGVLKLRVEVLQLRCLAHGW